jgi:hypothetical protein
MTKTVIVDAQQQNNVVTQTVAIRTVVTGVMGPPGAATFSQLRDIDLAQLGSGSLLVYNNQTQKWTATTLLDQQVVESGQF